MHFEIIEDKYLCVKNSRNLKYSCLSSKSLNFEESYDKNDESFQWEIQDIDEGVIVIKENDIYNPDKNNDPPKIYQPLDFDCPIDNFPCCSDNTEIIYTDEEGNWGLENDEWCFINKSTTTTTIISTPTSSECYFETLGYSCCPSEITEVAYTDEDGNKWGIINNEWCGI
ncbi:hypothetical protein BCR36DRAFT_290542, partial [Piromyces finnis]